MTNFLLSGFLLVSTLATSASAADLIAPQLREQIEKSRPNLGELPAWQEEIFTNEVLGASGRFIRDYKSVAGKVTKADVDLEGIKRYLSFNASQILKPDATKILLFVRAGGDCDVCAKAVNSVRADLKDRLERRGLVVMFPTAEELRREPTDAYSKRNAAGWVLADIRGEDDPDHPGDRRTSLLLDFRFPGTIASSLQKRMEILPSDSIEVSMGRVAIDTILEIGAKARTGFAATNIDSPGVEIALEGVTGFNVLAQVKSKLQAAMGNDYRVVEKRIERGRASLAVLAGNSSENKSAWIATQISGLALEGFKVQVLNVGEAKIDLQVTSIPAKGSA